MILHQLLIHSISFGHSLILELFQGTQTAQGLTIRHLNLLGGVPPPPQEFTYCTKGVFTSDSPDTDDKYKICFLYLRKYRFG